MTTKPRDTQQSNKIENSAFSTGVKECFIITPIGSVGSEIFNKTEGLIQSVLSPVLKKFGFIPIPAHYINKSGSINKQIIDKIVNCDLVIANLTGVNPNVMYELAIRHSFGKSIITMAERGTKLPFDIVDQRTLFYDDSMKGVDEIKPMLENAIEVCLSNDEVEQKISNPIYDALNQFAQIKSLPKEQQDGFEIILNKLDKLENDLYNNSKITTNQSQKISDTERDYIIFTLEIIENNKGSIESSLSNAIRTLGNKIKKNLAPRFTYPVNQGLMEVCINNPGIEFTTAFINILEAIDGVTGYHYDYSELPF